MRHSWRIEGREIARHEQRRGRRHAYERLDGGTTALVVVDMVPFFVDANPYARGIVPGVLSLAAAVRRAGGVVAWVVPAPEPPSPAREAFFGSEVWATYRASGGSGALRDRLWPGLAAEVDARDVLVEKTAPSAFFPGRCELPSLLARRSVDTVLVTGTVANVCCESTARDAATLGYRVVFVADANAAVRDEDLQATVHTLYRSFADVRTVDEVVALLAD